LFAAYLYSRVDDLATFVYRGSHASRTVSNLATEPLAHSSCAELFELFKEILGHLVVVQTDFLYITQLDFL
jgi:hypothetical protein